MITSLFGKSKPINFIICILIVLFYFVRYLFSGTNFLEADWLRLQIPIVLLLIFSLLLLDFIVKKNDLTRQNSYALLSATLYIGFFPDIFERLELVILYVLLLLSFRRIISLRSLYSVKKKLFDSALYLSFALLINSWMAIYFILIYAAIILYVSRDYRNWLVPFVAFFGAVFIYITYLVVTHGSFDISAFSDYSIHIEYDYFNYKKFIFHAAISLLFLIGFVIFILKYKRYSSQKRLSFLLMNLVYLLSLFIMLITNKILLNIELILLFPVAIFITKFLESLANNRVRELLLVLLMIVSFSSHISWLNIF